MVRKQLYEGNSDKSHLLLSCKQPSTVTINDTFIESNVKEVLLGIIIDRDLKFVDHIINFVKKHIKSLMLFLVLHLS